MDVLMGVIMLAAPRFARHFRKILELYVEPAPKSTSHQSGFAVGTC